MHGQGSPGDRGASQVVAVVLLVAVTIVLASMVTTVALEMGQDTRESVAAGAAADFQADADQVRVVFTAMQRSGTTLEATVYNGSNGSAAGTLFLTAVGNDGTFDLDDGHSYRVVVVAIWQDRRTVVLVKEGEL